MPIVKISAWTHVLGEYFPIINAARIKQYTLYITSGHIVSCVHPVFYHIAQCVVCAQHNKQVRGHVTCPVRKSHRL